MFSLSPRFTFCASGKSLAQAPLAKAETDVIIVRGANARPAVALYIREHPIGWSTRMKWLRLIHS
jgi:hypothetical protein